MFEGSGQQEHLDGMALVHGLVAFGDLVEGEREVEDLARIDLGSHISCISSGRKRRTGAGPP